MLGSVTRCHNLCKNSKKAMSHILSARPPDLDKRLPQRAEYMRACFEAFNKLRVTQDLTVLDHYSCGEPLWASHRFDPPLEGRQNIRAWRTKKINRVAASPHASLTC